jgi:AraC-like DNA-binding protein
VVGEPERFEVAGSDLDEARAVFERAYHGSDFRLEPTEGPTEYRYSSVGDDRVSLRTTLLRADGRGVMSTGDDVVVSWLTSGTGAFVVGGDEIVAVHGRPNVYPVGERFAFHYVDSSISLVHVDFAFLTEVAGLETSISGLRMDPRAVPDVDAVRRWNLAMRTEAPVLLDTESNPIARLEADTRIAAALLKLFPPSLGMPAAVLLPKNAHLRAAVEYVHERAHLPITTAEIAEESGISIRTLQAGFRRVLGSSPNEYLRNVRLDQVRVALLAADPTDTTVGDVANTWGFAHLGRFAGGYRARFAENPSETLHRFR